MGVPISPNTDFILACLTEVRENQLAEMKLVWGEEVWSHHESYLLQRTCIQPKVQYILRAIIPDIPEQFMERWDRDVEGNYPKYIQSIPKEYRLQPISQGGLQLVPPSIIRIAASMAFQSSNNIDNLKANVKEYIQATTKQSKSETLQQTITRFLNWYSLQMRVTLEKFQEVPSKGKTPNLPSKLLTKDDNSLVRGRPTVMTPQDSSWLSRLPNKKSDVLDTLGFKIALTMRYNLEWDEDKELNRLSCPNHKKASNSDGRKPCQLSLRHALGCGINAEGKIVSRHDSIVRIIGRTLAANGLNPRVEESLPYEENGKKKKSTHRPDVLYMAEDKMQVFDVTVGSFKNGKDKESWTASNSKKKRQYKELTDVLKDKVQINIVQFDVAARVGSETEKILDRIGMRRNVVTNIQLMILSLNSWLYKNAIQKAVAERNEGRGVGAQQWANKMMADY